MAEYGLGETRCQHWPSTCAEVQARTPTNFRFCDFCLYGPPEDPHREVRDVTEADIAEMEERIAAPERELGEGIRRAVIAMHTPAREEER